MKTEVALVSVLFALAFASAAPGVARAAEPAKRELVIYAYDSLVAEGGLGPEIFPRFEKRCGCKLRVHSPGDAGQLVSRLQLDAERGKRVADVVLGLDQATFERAKPWLHAWASPVEFARAVPGLERLVPEVRGMAEGFVPFDYGVFAFIADREQLRKRGLPEPRKLSDLLKPEWKRNLILEDPRTSTPGLAFLLYAREAGGQGFWARFRNQWLTLAPGWDAAYGLFLKSEAPLVWSYTTSQAYHEEHGDRGDGARRYSALTFEEGQPLQVEGAALAQGVDSPERRKLALEFLDYLLGDEVQAAVPKRNWMLPAAKGVKLPASFGKLPKPRRVVRTPSAPAHVERALSEWADKP